MTLKMGLDHKMTLMVYRITAKFRAKHLSYPAALMLTPIETRQLMPHTGVVGGGVPRRKLGIPKRNGMNVEGATGVMPPPPGVFFSGVHAWLVMTFNYLILLVRVKDQG